MQGEGKHVRKLITLTISDDVSVVAAFPPIDFFGTAAVALPTPPHAQCSVRVALPFSSGIFLYAVDRSAVAEG